MYRKSYYKKYEEKNESSLTKDLKNIEADINNLKITYKEIDTFKDKLIFLVNKKLKLHLQIITKSGPNTPYQKAVENLVLKKYIQNPDLIDPNIFSDVVNFFTQPAEWIIDDEDNFINEKNIYDKEREKTGEFELHRIEEQIEKILDIERIYGTASNDELEFYGLKKIDRPDFEEVSGLKFKSYYGTIKIKPEGCTIGGDLILSESDCKNYRNEIESLLEKINSESFKKNLDNNFNKLKNIIKTVGLNYRLGKKNKINYHLNKILNRGSQKLRIKKHETTNGYIYILTNKAFPKYIKIGSTMKDPKIRADELTGTGLPFPYVVMYIILTKNCEILEKKIHIILDKKRINLEREFFECSIEEAKNIIIEVIKNNAR